MLLLNVLWPSVFDPIERVDVVEVRHLSSFLCHRMITGV
jgi:hypothetical protein